MTTLQDTDFAVIDTETTGIGADAGIIELAVVHAAYRERPRVAFCVRINPGCPIEPGATSAHGITDAELSRRIRAWRPTEPPAGEGYQIWQTVSEGGPVSPVFASPEELARWMVKNDRSITRDTTYEGWLQFILGPGWALTAISQGATVTSGTAQFNTGEAK